MDTVISFTPAQLWALLLGLCAGISCIAGAAVWITKVIQAFRTPNRRQDERIASLEARVAKHDEFFGNDKRRFESIEAGNRITQRAILALLSHGIDGNNTDEMKQARKDLHEYVFNK